MSVTDRFSGAVTTIEALREIYPEQFELVDDKTIDHLDDHCRAFIARSPFVLIASSDGAGHFDISPKGDPAGFVRVLDDHTLAIPDRPGNHRVDTFTNVIRHPHVGLIFLIPGVRNTLRVSGRATVVTDEDLRASMAIDGRVPALALVVEVEEAFAHCAKCIIRSKLWSGEGGSDGLPSLGRMMVDHSGSDLLTVEQMDEIVQADEADNLY